MKATSINFNNLKFEYIPTNVLSTDFYWLESDYDKLQKWPENACSIKKGGKYVFWLTLSQLPEKESPEEFIVYCLNSTLGRDEDRNLLQHLDNLIQIYDCIRVNDFKSIPLNRTFGRKYKIARWIDYYEIFFWSGKNEMYFEFTTPISIIEHPKERFILDYETAGKLFISFLSVHINFIKLENPDNLDQKQIKEIQDKFTKLQVSINSLLI